MKQADKDKALPEGTIFPMDQQIYRKGEVVPTALDCTRIPATGKVRLFLLLPLAPEIRYRKGEVVLCPSVGPEYPLQER